MADYDKIIERVFGKQYVHDRKAREHDPNPIVAGLDLSSMTDEQLLAALRGFQIEVEGTRRDYDIAKRARMLLAHYIWANRGTVKRGQIMAAMGTSTSHLTRIIASAQEHLRMSMDRGTILPDGTEPPEVRAIRATPAWAMETPLDNAILDLRLYGGYA